MRGISPGGVGPRMIQIGRATLRRLAAMPSGQGVRGMQASGIGGSAAVAADWRGVVISSGSADSARSAQGATSSWTDWRSVPPSNEQSPREDMS